MAPLEFPWRSSRKPMPAATRKTIAIVDDDRLLREALQDLLEAEGFESHLYACAEAFLSQFDARPVDCIVADVRMTGMSGIDMLGILQAKPHCPPVLIMTSYGDARMEGRALSGGATAFLAKPLDSRKLIACIRKAVA
ncbi:response regulator transcription factor [Shinella sp. S4-D37]|uniref:response regulator transcription factor n=1 Tax=Shinella sp. S4-D37 TaxID=3161999 RepID=UPI003464FDD2